VRMPSQNHRLSRRGLIRSIGALLAAPAIVRVANLMPVHTLPAFELPEIPGCVVAGQVFWDELMTATMRIRSRQLAENVLANNALLQRLQRAQ